MLISHGETDIGKRRKINEDSIFAANGLFVVCDGMGGHKAGEVASSLAVETIARFVERSDEDRELTWPFGFNPQLSFNGNRLRTAVKLANRAVFRQANGNALHLLHGQAMLPVQREESVQRRLNGITHGVGLDGRLGNKKVATQILHHLARLR